MKCIALLLLGFMVIGGCKKKVVVKHPPGPPPHAKAYGYRAKYVYWYYPALEIYYYPKLKTYAVLKEGNWIIVETPPSILTSGSSYVIIETESENPWLKHSYYKGKYPLGKAKGRHRGK